MIKLFNEKEFNNAKRKDLLPLQCKICNKTFFKYKFVIVGLDAGKIEGKGYYCSNKCMGIGKLKPESNKEVNCLHCNKLFSKRIDAIKRYPNNFCSLSCSTTYKNLHKSTGTKRSKLEIWLEEQLKTLYPDLKIIFNGKETINSELDIYIPSLNLAIELNGIFHYEPIYEIDKLLQIKNNDNRKFQACIDKKIELLIIDTSSVNYVKPEKVKKYLDIIANIINAKIQNH